MYRLSCKNKMVKKIAPNSLLFQNSNYIKKNMIAQLCDPIFTTQILEKGRR